MSELQEVGQGIDRDTDELLRGARRDRSECELRARDYQCKVFLLTKRMSQAKVARKLGVSRPAVAKMIRGALEMPQRLEGFSGATPYEIAQRYAAGDIDRATAMAELVRWPYTPGLSSCSESWANLEHTPEGTLGEVGRAYDDGLLDAGVHDEILRRAAARKPAS